VVTLVGECPLVRAFIRALEDDFAGLAIGVNAALISIVTEWLSDLKTGYCYDGWWLNQQFCCWEIEYEDENGCDSWHPWSTAWPAQYLVYIVFAVSKSRTMKMTLTTDLPKATFSFVAAHLVKNLAKYAAGSGISEIKCILAGFIMKGFLGFSTLLLKSLTLVSGSLILIHHTNFSSIASRYRIRPVSRQRRPVCTRCVLHRQCSRWLVRSLLAESWWVTDLSLQECSLKFAL
jgi:hypothetical protein